MAASNAVNLFTAAYNSSGFVPSNPLTNYIGDAGASFSVQTFGFTIAAGQSFTVVVHEVGFGGAGATASPYNLTIAFNTCPAGPTCTPITITTSSIASGSKNIAYSQAFTATGGSGSYNFSVTGAPTGLAFSGNVLTGSPTQAGSFPITVTANDNTGCPSGSKGYTLVIANVVFGDLNGDNQVTVSDLVILANIIAGNINPTPTQKTLGDVFQDGSGQITIQDLVTMANFLAGNIHNLPVVSGPIMNPGGGPKPEFYEESFLNIGKYDFLRTAARSNIQSLDNLDRPRFRFGLN
jgi:hypothetical protein